jgi:hypothetical protein
LGLTGSKKVNSLRHIAGNGILESPDYQESAVAIHDRLKRLPEKSELKQDAYHVGGMLLGAGVSNRKNHSKRNKLLASSALLSLGTKHNKEVTGNSLKVLKKQKNRAEEIAAYLKSIPRATNDFYKDRMELAKQNESQPPVDSSPQQPAGKGLNSETQMAGNYSPQMKEWLTKHMQKNSPPGKGIGNLVGLMSKPRRKGQGIKDKLKKAAKVVLPAAAAAAALYAGHKVANRGISMPKIPHYPTIRLGGFKPLDSSPTPSFVPRGAVSVPKEPLWSLDDLIARQMYRS